MNDTHTFDDKSDGTDSGTADQDPVAVLADMDPAEAPGPAERYAASLAADLEDAGAPASDPVQLRANLEDGKATERS